MVIIFYLNFKLVLKIIQFLEIKNECRIAEILIFQLLYVNVSSSKITIFKFEDFKKFTI